MASRFVARWNNVGDGNLLNAFNRGATSASQQITGGLGGVGQALEDYSKNVKAKNTGNVLAQLAKSKDEAELDKIVSGFEPGANVDEAAIAKAIGDTRGKHLSASQFNQTANALAENRKAQLALSGRDTVVSEANLKLSQDKFAEDKRVTGVNENALTTASNQLSQSVQSISDTAGSGSGDHPKELLRKAIIKSSGGIPDQKTKKEFLANAFLQAGISSDKAELKSNIKTDVMSTFQSDINSNPGITLQELESRITDLSKSNTDINPSELRGTVGNLYIDKASNDIINTIGEDTINDAALRVTELMANYTSLGDEDREIANAGIKQSSKKIQEVLNAVSQYANEQRLSTPMRKEILARISGENSALGRLQAGVKAINKTVSTVTGKRVAAIEEKADNKKAAFDKFTTANTPETLQASFEKKYASTPEKSDEIEEIKTNTDDLIRTSPEVMKANPQYIVAAVKELVSIQDDDWFGQTEKIKGNKSGEILARAWQLMNKDIKDKTFIKPISTKAKADIKAAIDKLKGKEKPVDRVKVSMASGRLGALQRAIQNNQ